MSYFAQITNNRQWLTYHDLVELLSRQVLNAVSCEQFAMSCLQVALVSVPRLEPQGAVHAVEWRFTSVATHVFLKCQVIKSAFEIN